MSVLLTNVTKIYNPNHSRHEREVISLSRKNRQHVQFKQTLSRNIPEISTP